MLSNFLNNMDAALRRKAFKPNAGFVVDPVPARTAESLGNTATRMGAPNTAAIRDPVPATAAEDFIMSHPFHPNSGFMVDPIPARSV